MKKKWFCFQCSVYDINRSVSGVNNMLELVAWLKTWRVGCVTPQAEVIERWKETRYLVCQAFSSEQKVKKKKKVFKTVLSRRTKHPLHAVLLNCRALAARGRHWRKTRATNASSPAVRSVDAAQWVQTPRWGCLVFLVPQSKKEADVKTLNDCSLFHSY